jgi:glycosyltransferase involved in cell wall biosynthesis
VERALSTIILNWNRDYLLKQCAESYLSTVGDGVELIIVDNQSTDGSNICMRWRARGRSISSASMRISAVRPSIAIPIAGGDLIHLSEASLAG